MAKTLEGIVVFATFQREDTYPWTNPADGKVKHLRSVKVLLPHGDGSVTKESLGMPDNYRLPPLTAGEVYGFPVIASVSRKKGTLSLNLREDMKPFPAPPVE